MLLEIYVINYYDPRRNSKQTRNMNTSQSIMLSLQKMAETPGGTDPHVWLRGALKLRVLLQKDQEELVELERELQETKRNHLLDGDTAINAKIKIEASMEFAHAKKKEVFIKTCLDTILLAKKFAQTEMDIYRSQ